jgi:hypothetical protein
LLFLSNLDAHGFFDEKASDAPVTLVRIEVCEDLESGPVKDQPLARRQKTKVATIKMSASALFVIHILLREYGMSTPRAHLGQEKSDMPAIEDVMVSFLLGTHLQRECIGPRARLGEAERAELTA